MFQPFKDGDFMYIIAQIGMSLFCNTHLKCYRFEKLDEKDLGMDNDSQETGTSGETPWSNKTEDENISDSQSIVTEGMEEEEEYEIMEFDDWDFYVPFHFLFSRQKHL